MLSDISPVLQKGHTDRQGFTWDKLLGGPSTTSDIEWVAGYLLSLSEMEMISTIKEYFAPEHVARLAKALGV